MNATLKSIIAAAALSTTIACSDAVPTGPSAMLPESAAQASSKSQLTFNNTQSYSDEQAFSATGGQGQISFTGSITTGTPCYNVTGASQTGTGTVTLTVTAAPNGNSCIQVVTFNNYSGAVSRLAAGSYTFQVVHVQGGTSQTVFTQPVTVS